MSVHTSAYRRRAFAMFTGVLIVAVSAACTPSDSSVSTTPKKADSSAGSSAGGGTKSAAPKATSKPKAKAAELGDTIALKGFDSTEKADVTLVAIVDNAKAVDEFSTPDSGNRFYAVQFRIKDTGSAAYNDSPSNGATIVDSKGQSYSADFNDTKAGHSFPGSVNIAPGSSGLGFITFQVPKGAKITSVQFGLDSGMSDQTGQWSVG